MVSLLGLDVRGAEKEEQQCEGTPYRARFGVIGEVTSDCDQQPQGT
jgi:hypothetical protein